MAARVLVIAGHDSSGRAGIDADREAVRSAGAECVEVVTAWTVQEGSCVRSVDARPARDWEAEALAALGAGVGAIKIGLLPGRDAVASAVRVLGAGLAAGLPCVVDPVLGASSGEAFLDRAAIALFCAEVLALPIVLTPNLPEAVRLLGKGDGPSGRPREEAGAGDPGAAAVAFDLAQVEYDLGARRSLGEALLAGGLGGLVLKGGHGGEDPVADLVLGAGGEVYWERHARVPGPGIRGSGCRHASRLAASLARGIGGACGAVGGRSAEGESAEWALGAGAAEAASYVAACIARGRRGA